MALNIIPPFKLANTTDIIPRSTGITHIYGNTGGFSLSVGGTSAATAQLDIICASASTIGHLVQLAASQSADALQVLNSGAIKRSSIDNNGMLNFWASQTESLTSILTGVTLGGTITLGSSANLGLNIFNSAITFSNGASFGVMPYMCTFNPTVTFASSNNNLANGQIFFSNPTYVSSNSSNNIFLGSLGSHHDRPIFSVASSGTWDSSSAYSGYRSAFTINTGVTWGTRSGYVVVDGSGSGTLTTQIGVDILSLTKGSTNIALRTGASGEIQLGNLITKYNNIATVSNGVPSELATADLTAQTAAKSATTLYTPTATGLYRVSAYLQVTTAASTSSVLGGTTGVVITYNDGDGNVAQSVTMLMNTNTGTSGISSAGNTTTTNLNGRCTIYARTGVAIKYAIDYTSVGVTAMQYAAHLKLEAL